MKKYLLLSMAVLLLLLSACQGPDAEASPSVSPVPSPSGEAGPSPTAGLPDFVAQFTFTQVEVLSTESGELEYQIYPLDEQARSTVQSLLAMESWTETEIPEQSLGAEYILSDDQHNTLAVSREPDDRYLLLAKTLDGESWLYAAPLEVLEPFRDYMSALVSSDSPQVPIASPPDEAPTTSAWQVDGSTLTDEYLISLISGMEIGLIGDNSFTFSAPAELSESELYLCFLLLSDHDELVAKYWDDEDQVFTFTSDVITAQLSKYFKDFHFDITQDYNYDAQADAIVTPLASGFGGDRRIILTDKSLDGNTVTFTIDFYGFDDNVDETDPYQTKTYTIEFYDGGYYYLSAVISDPK